MAFRVGQSVIGGMIDNCCRGTVTGSIRLLGRDEPLSLRLTGDCLRDLAGRRIVFENACPRAGDRVGVPAEFQGGAAGNMTASLKVKRLACSPEETRTLCEAGREFPMCWANVLYLEWFSETDGRVVIEIPNFVTKELTPSEWSLSKQEEQELCRRNLALLTEYVERLDGGWDEEPPVWSPEDDASMDEFGWERFLRRQEPAPRSSKFHAILNRYLHHPDRDRLVAREMGWDYFDDLLDARDHGAFGRAGLEPAEEVGEWEAPQFEVEHFSEDEDWKQPETIGFVKHPLSERTFDLAVDMWRRCESCGLMHRDKDGDTDAEDMVLAAESLTVELSGALDRVGEDHEPESGLTVALLKRALKQLGFALGASKKVVERNVMNPAVLKAFRNDMFDIREKILTIMSDLRSRAE